MKSERRHELQTNELADWMGNLPQWFEENKFNVLISAVMVVIIAVSFYLWTSRNDYSVSREQYEFTTLAGQVQISKLQAASAKTEAGASTDAIRSAAEKLQGISGKLGSNESQAMALIESANADRTQAHFMAGADEKAIQYQMEKAKKDYQQALDKGSKSVQIASLATFGLGITEEEQGNYENARTYYSKIANDPNYAGTVGAPLAATRIATLADYKDNFVFVDAPKAPAQTMPTPEPNKAPAAPNAPAKK